MKNSFLISLLVGSLLLGSCDLDETSYGFYSEDNFYKTEADAEAAVLYAYRALTYLEYANNVFFLGDMPSESIYSKSDVMVDRHNLDYWIIDDYKTNTVLEQYFKYAFIGINRANAVIKNVETSHINENVKKQYLGEAHFLRAWNYFNLVRNFGLVPIHNTVIETVDQTSAPLPENMDQLYNNILSDCRQAIELLPIFDTPKIGRADKVAAQALAAKSYLYVASAKEHGVKLYKDMNRDITAMYDSAAYYANEVIEKQQTYGFENSLFDIYDVEKARGREHIFIMAMDRTGLTEGQYSKISKFFIPYVDGGTLYLKQGDTDEYIPTHDGFGEFRTETAFYDRFNPNDRRKTDLIVHSVYDKEHNVYASIFNKKLPYPFSRKFIDPNFLGDKTSTRPFLIRFSDVALIYAESAGPTTKSYQLVNFIRHRANLDDLPSGLSKKEFREKIFEERTFELSFEGDHMYDLRRLNRILTDIPAAAGLTEDDVTFYPLPQAEINLNENLRN